MTKASETPSITEGSIIHSVAGGARRDKAGRPTRISPRLSSVSGATGAGAVLFATTVLLAAPCLAEDPAEAAWPVSSARAAAAAAAPLAPPAQRAPTSTAASTADTATDSAHPPPKRWPPSVQLLSPSAPLGRKARVSVNLVHKWQDRNIKPTMGPRGEVRFIYGATQDTVVCAPLRICDIALQPGEIVQNINLGDTTMWNCPPGISGTGAEEVTHLLCKPADAGLTASLAIQTSRRSYSIELVSTQHNYMPKISWSYPDDQAAQWAAYQQHGGGQGHAVIPTQGYIHYDITGDNPPWRPVAVYSDGKSTFIQFPPAMFYGKAPVLERLP